MHKVLWRNVTLTFNLATWFLFATHCPVVIIICAQLFLNPLCITKLWVGQKTGSTEVYAQSLSADCDLNLWPSNMVYVHDTSSCHDDHLCQIIFSNPTMHDKVMDGTRTGSAEVYAQILSADCDLDLRPSDMVLVRNTVFCHDDYLSQIIFQFHYA